MMTFKCAACGKEFTSEVEFKDHQMMENLLLANRNLVNVIAWICGELRLMNMLHMIQNPVSEEQIESFVRTHEKCMQIINRVNQEMQEKINKDNEAKKAEQSKVLDDLGKQLE